MRPSDGQGVERALGSAFFVGKLDLTRKRILQATDLDTADSNKQDEGRFWQETGQARDVALLAEPVLEDMGYRLVRVKITGENGCTVQVMAETPEGTLGIADCADISRTLSPLFDIEDPVAQSYHLEISSPGIDRPLVRASDFERYAGLHVKIELKELISGRRRFRGTIEGAADGEARILVDLAEFDEPQVIGLPLANIAEAHIVFEPGPRGRKKAAKRRG
jgi:ribosome maturation factor RimP